MSKILRLESVDEMDRNRVRFGKILLCFLAISPGPFAKRVKRPGLVWCCGMGLAISTESLFVVL